MDQRRNEHSQHIRDPLFSQCKQHRDHRDAHSRSLLDAGKGERIAAGGKEQKGGQRVIRREPMRKDNIARDGQKRPEHQEILRGNAVHFQLIIHPVEQRVCTNTLVGVLQKALGNQLIAVPVSTGVVAVRPQTRKARKQYKDHQRAEHQPMPPAGLQRSDRHMVSAPRQTDRYEHDNG